jgi:peptide methionine sulfoxide reductase msrA/msrB
MMNSQKVNSAKVIFAAGCFWGVEHFFQQVKGVIATTVGYAGGHTQNPAYQQVSSGVTGHAEAVEVLFNPTEISFEKLVLLFFEMHNPALITNTQGKRSQYRSAIFYLNEEQKAIAEKLMQKLRDKSIAVRTELQPAGVFYAAEDYHQNYYSKKGTNGKVRQCTPKF